MEYLISLANKQSRKDHQHRRDAHWEAMQKNDAALRQFITRTYSPEQAEDKRLTPLEQANGIKADWAK